MPVVRGKNIEPLYTARQIDERNHQLAAEIAKGPANDLLVIAVLKGSFIFAADLIRALHDVGLAPEVEFITLSSYGTGTVSQGVRIVKDIDSDVHGRDVLLIDDILESGRTLKFAKELLYERGAFNPETTSIVAGTLAIYGLGLPGFVMIKALQPGFYAREDTRTPMRFTGISVVINSALAISLFPILAERGIAIAEAAAGWINTVLLFITLHRRGHLTWEWALFTRTLRLMVAAAIMAVMLVYLSDHWSAWLAPEASLSHQLAALGGLVAIAMVVYFGIAFAIGGADLGMLRRNLRRKPKA